MVLKVMVKRLMGIKDDLTIELIARDLKRNHEYPMDDDSQTLDFYGVENGYSILVKTDKADR